VSRSRKDAKGGHVGKGPGYEYWTSRFGHGGAAPGRWSKTQTHRRERRAGKALHDALNPRKKEKENTNG
jgi:hypothetical protein